MDESTDDIPTRPMRVKVLYTFDQQNKDNCLARISDVLNIPAVAIDESTQVGVIELRQCIEAVTAASPELLSRLGDGDFTIYAYDYSEPDTPLVGQGTLSAVFNASQQDQQSQSMITGRVCKNVMALFKNGPKETLEVKLRLTPMAKPAQMDFSKSMEILRSMSPAMSSGFDPNAWNNSMQQNRMQQQTNDYFNFDTAQTNDGRDLKTVDDVFGFANGFGGNGSGGQEAGIAETPMEPNPAFSHSAPGSRAGSPMMVSGSDLHNSALRHQSFSGQPSNFENPSRPTSRASIRSDVSASRHQRQGSAQSLSQQSQIQPQTEVFYNEDGQARKRAKVMQADWRGRSSFGTKSADLRVNAATAASMQMHRPIAKRPMAPGSNLEPPPRVPTPVPNMNRMSQTQQQMQISNPRGSLLRQASTADSDFMSDLEQYSDALMSSPEEDSPDNSVNADGTPFEIPSSPPVFAGMHHPQPSSPGLPTLPPPHMPDSGYMSERNFMSGNIVDSLENDDDRSLDSQGYQDATQHKSFNSLRRSQSSVKIEGTGNARPMRTLYPASNTYGDVDAGSEKEGSQGSSSTTSVPAKRNASGLAAPPSRSDLSTLGTGNQDRQFIAAMPSDFAQSRRNSLALPALQPAPSSDLPQPSRPTAKKRPKIQCSQTTFNDSEAGSPAPSDTEGLQSKGMRRSGSGAPRRKVIQSRLDRSIEQGVLPIFCYHCGAIETPTWRRLYVKHCEGKPTGLDRHEGEGETISIEVTEWDPASGEATAFVIRKSMKKTKDNLPGNDFESIQVCNPCGLWFNKNRAMRPADRWNNNPRYRKSRKQDLGDSGPATDGFEPQSEAFYTDQVVPDETTNNPIRIQQQAQQDLPTQEAAAPATDRPRANSLQPQEQRRGSQDRGLKASQLNAAMTRAVQSSPGFQGSQKSPIEIEDLTPRPTRRMLFPSPRRAGEVKSLDDNQQVTLKTTLSAIDEVSVQAGDLKQTSASAKPGLEVAFEHRSDTNVFEAFTYDKENISPSFDIGEGDLSHLFEGSPTMLFKTPRKTPTKNATSPRSMKQLNHLLKTPTPSSRKRMPLTPNATSANGAHVATAAQQAMNDFMTSPTNTRYFLRSTPSRLERTPGRNTLSHHSSDNEASPWSRHLAQMLSDANDGSTSVGLDFTSPNSRQFGDFSDLPNFTTRGRMALDGCDWEGLLGSYDGSEGMDGGDGHVGS